MSQIRDLWNTLKTTHGAGNHGAGNHGAVWLPVLPPVGAFVELVLVMGLIYLVSYLIPGIDLATLEPSPFWVPVLLLSLQYGTVAGLLAAAVATLAYTVNGLPEQAIGENLFAFLLRIWALPILWIGVALVLGQFRLRQIEVKQSLKQRLGSRTMEAESLASYASALEDRCNRLERQLTSVGPASGAAAMDCLVAFTDSSVDVSKALDELRQHAFPQSRLTVFTVSPAALDVIAASAGDGVAPPPGSVPAHHPLYRAVVSERRTLSVLRAEDEAALAGVAHAAQPILHPDTRRVIGLFCLETSDPAQLSQELNARLAMIARFIAPCLSEPRIVVDNTERAVHAVDTNSGRLTSGWRQLSWQKAPSPETAEPSPSSDEDVARSKSRPIVFQ